MDGTPPDRLRRLPAHILDQPRTQSVNTIDISHLFKPLIVLVGALALVGIIAAVAKGRTRLRIERKAFLTRAELDLLTILRRILPEHHVSCQVSMGALLRPQRGLSRKEFWRTRNRFGQKITDFVVIDPDTGSVEAIIELDDATHDPRKDRERDAMLALGHYRVVRIPSKPRPSVQSVREQTAFLHP